MIDLKKEVMGAFDKLNTAWVSAVKEGSKPESEGIDLAEVLSKYSEIVTDLDDRWNEGMVRIKNKKGKFW